MRKIIDLSLIVEEGILMPFLKEREKPFVLDVVKTHDSGPAHGTVVEMYLHVGTHIDAPLHFFRGGDTIDLIPLDRLVGDAKDSPIVEAGSKDQYSFTLGISKRFSLDLF